LTKDLPLDETRNASLPLGIKNLTIYVVSFHFTTSF
jgi:hypothetical protein